MAEQRIVQYRVSGFPLKSPQARFQKDAEKLAKEGWYVHSVTSESLGTSGFFFGRIGINSTVNNIIVVYRRDEIPEPVPITQRKARKIKPLHFAWQDRAIENLQKVREKQKEAARIRKENK